MKPDTKLTLSVVIAFAIGAFGVYAIMSPRHSEEWGLVAADGIGGAHLSGLFESKAKCLDARTASVEQAATMLQTYGKVEKSAREVVFKDPNDGPQRMTFSCLPLSEIRGLSLRTGTPQQRD